MKPALVLGTHTYAASGDALRRQERGVATLRALRDVRVVDVQFSRGAHEMEGITTLRALERDSTTATGRSGPRKPLVSDILAVAFLEAERCGATYFGFTNADILFSQDAVTRVVTGGRDAYVLARQDLDAETGRANSIGVYGTDAFIIATRWWRRHHGRFRGYILGEPVWDNVYTSVLMCHADTAIENRTPLVRHEAHPQNWTTAGPFAEYTRLLAAYDATYFSMWCAYVGALVEMRGRGSSAQEEDEVARRVFRWPPPLRTRAIQRLRNVKASIRYAAPRLLRV